MKQFIDFYMVVISPWCYLGLNRLISISKIYDNEINIKPIDIFSIFKEYGTKVVQDRPLPVQINRINEWEIKNPEFQENPEKMEVWNKMMTIFNNGKECVW